MIRQTEEDKSYNIDGTMNNKKKAQKIVTDTLKIVTDKREEIKNWNKAIPTLNRANEQLEWERDAISAIPNEEIDRDIITRLDCSHNYWVTSIGDPSNFYPATTSAVAINVSSSSKIYKKVDDYSKKHSANSSVKVHLHRYHQIQKSQNVEENVYNRLKVIRQIKPTVDRQFPIHVFFKDAVTAIEHAKSGTGSMDDAGKAMRNVLWAFKGTLDYRSMANKGKGSKEDKRKRMADYFAKTGGGSSEHTALVNEFENYSQLISDLSILEKRLLEINFGRSDFDSLVARFLDHLEAVLNLIDLPKLM